MLSSGLCRLVTVTHRTAVATPYSSARELARVSQASHMWRRHFTKPPPRVSSLLPRVAAGHDEGRGEAPMYIFKRFGNSGQTDEQEKETTTRQEPQYTGAQVSMPRSDNHANVAHVVTTAIASNCAVCAGKFGTFLYTGSGTMLAEAVHSLADVMNQVLLAVGHRRSARPPDKTHPYGYAREQFVWALISAVGIFFLGGGASIYHGIHELVYPPELDNFHMAYGMLAFSAVAEGASLYVAYKAIKQGARELNMSFADYLNKGGDPITVAVFMEDSAAILGLGVASVSLGLAHYTGMAAFDAVGSILIGNILGGVAIFLINRNMGALVGRTVDKRRLVKIWDLLKEDPVVMSVHDIKAEVMGTEMLRFKADIEFNGEVVCQRYLQAANNGPEIIEALDRCVSDEEKEKVLVAYGKNVIEALGDEVDRIEEDIQRTLPAVQFIDLETN